MKYIISFLVLIFGLAVSGQTIIEKYNSLYNRYEYYNSNNQLTGYKQYNSLYGRWEYYDVQNDPYYNPKPRTYATPKSQLGNQGQLMSDVLREKDRQYRRGEEILNNKVAIVASYLIPLKKHKDLPAVSKRYNQIRDIENTLNRLPTIDPGNSSQVNQLLRALNTLESRLLNIITAIQKENDASSQKATGNRNQKNYSKQNSSSTLKSSSQISSSKTKSFNPGDYVTTLTYAPILDKPNNNGKKIGRVENKTVKIIRKVNDKFYRVVSENTTGYISILWLKEKK